MTLLHPARLRRLPALLISCLALTALGLLATPPAAAHPFGDPQTIEVSAVGEGSGEVRLRWKVGGTDDLTALALHLGLLPADRVLLDGAVLYEDGDGELLGASPAFADYLLQRVRVTAQGALCAGELLPVTDLVDDGAVLSFACGPGAATADVEARMLTDLHPDYRTLASGPDGQRAVYDDENPQHTWDLTASGPSSGTAAQSAALQIGSALGVGGVVAGGVGAAFYYRRRGRREGDLAA